MSEKFLKKFPKLLRKLDTIYDYVDAHPEMPDSEAKCMLDGIMRIRENLKDLEDALCRVKCPGELACDDFFTNVSDTLNILFFLEIMHRHLMSGSQ